MVDAELKPPRGARVGVAVLVGLLHLIAVAVLVRAFAPQIGASTIRPTIEAFDVTVAAPLPDPPPPEPPPRPEPKRAAAAPPAQGEAAPAGRKAQPREVSAPTAKLDLATRSAPPVAGLGAADRAGASAAGPGTGAGGSGQGPGAGGGGGAARPVKIAGDIVSARDYPRKTRDLRLGSAVMLVLKVSSDGRVSGCRIIRSSRDPEADRITCRLATERFRFRPARDSTGRAVEASYGWQQRWFTPARD